MEQIINELVIFFGINDTPETFMELVVWFIKMSFGCSLFRYVLFSMLVLCQEKVQIKRELFS